MKLIALGRKGFSDDVSAGPFAHGINAAAEAQRLRMWADRIEAAAKRVTKTTPDGTRAPIVRRRIFPIEVVEAPGDRCGNTKRLPDGSPCPGCRACC